VYKIILFVAFVLWMISVAFMAQSQCHTYPDAPQPQVTHQWKAPADGFFSFRKSWKDPVLRPNRKSWLIFGLSHAAGWAAVSVACSRYPRSNENWGSEAPAMAGVTALDFLVFKFVSPSMSWESQGYAVYHYGAAAKR